MSKPSRSRSRLLRPATDKATIPSVYPAASPATVASNAIAFQTGLASKKQLSRKRSRISSSSSALVLVSPKTGPTEGTSDAEESRAPVKKRSLGIKPTGLQLRSKDAAVLRSASSSGLLASQSGGLKSKYASSKSRPASSAGLVPRSGHYISPPVSPENQQRSDSTNADRPKRRAIPDVVLQVEDKEFAEVWKSLEFREEEYHANPEYMKRHPTMKGRMRSLLADWLIEVAEEFGLHRETYYTSMNFVDRYLSATSNIHKSYVQLIGVSALFTASKIQEIYPPRLSKFANLTDGACTEEQILWKEMELLLELKWNLSPVTPVAWLEVYLQTASLLQKRSTMAELQHREKYLKTIFVGVCQLLDFATLEYGSVRFSPSVLAATALIIYAGSRVDTLKVTGYGLDQLRPCLSWMLTYGDLLQERCVYGTARSMRNLQVADAHTIQIHANPFELFEAVHRSQSRSENSTSNASSTRGVAPVVPGLIPTVAVKGKVRASQTPTRPDPSRIADTPPTTPKTRKPTKRSKPN